MTQSLVSQLALHKTVNKHRLEVQLFTEVINISLSWDTVIDYFQALQKERTLTHVAICITFITWWLQHIFECCTASHSNYRTKSKTDRNLIVFNIDARPEVWRLNWYYMLSFQWHKVAEEILLYIFYDAFAKQLDLTQSKTQLKSSKKKRKNDNDKFYKFM